MWLRWWTSHDPSLHIKLLDLDKSILHVKRTSLSLSLLLSLFLLFFLCPCRSVFPSMLYSFALPNAGCGEKRPSFSAFPTPGGGCRLRQQTGTNELLMTVKFWSFQKHFGPIAHSQLERVTNDWLKRRAHKKYKISPLKEIALTAVKLRIPVKHLRWVYVASLSYTALKTFFFFVFFFTCLIFIVSNWYSTC